MFRPAQGGRPLIGVLALAVAAQLPLAVLAVMGRTFTSDWMLLVPGVSVLASWGVLGGAGPLGRPGRAWVAILGVHFTFVLATPFVLAAVAPNPAEDPDWFRRGLPRLFAQSSTGGLWNTHQIPIQEGLAGEPLARLLSEAGWGEVALLDLSVHTWDGSRPCYVSGGEWIWGPADPLSAGREWPPWPYLFHDVDLSLDRISNFPFGTEEWRSAPVSGDAVTAALLYKGMVRPILVRLWAEADSGLRRSWRSCGPFRPTEDLLTDAPQILHEAFPEYGLARVFQDLGGELVGMEAGADRDSRYLSRALLFSYR
jgi:hypothetical protein